MKVGINTNYNTPTSKTPFTSKFILEDAENMLATKEHDILKKIVSTIGEATDIIKVQIGETCKWSEGNDYAGDSFIGYPMKVISSISGDIKETNLEQKVSIGYGQLPAPFEPLKSYLKKLQKIITPGFKEAMSAKLQNLNIKLNKLEDTKKALEARLRGLENQEKTIQKSINEIQKEFEI